MPVALPLTTTCSGFLVKLAAAVIFAAKALSGIATVKSTDRLSSELKLILPYLVDKLDIKGPDVNCMLDKESPQI